MDERTLLKSRLFLQAGGGWAVSREGPKAVTRARSISRGGSCAHAQGASHEAHTVL